MKPLTYLTKFAIMVIAMDRSSSNRGHMTSKLSQFHIYYEGI